MCVVCVYQQLENSKNGANFDMGGVNRYTILCSTDSDLVLFAHRFNLKVTVGCLVWDFMYKLVPIFAHNISNVFSQLGLKTSTKCSNLK